MFSVILGMLLTIINCRKVTRRQLAEKFEIDKRTVSRYLDIIAAAGVPIESSYGKYGGISIPDTYRVDNFFSKAELLRLSTCIRATMLSFDDGLCAALLDKLGHMAKNKDDEKYLLKSDSLIIDIGTWTNPQQQRHKIELVNKAIDSELVLEIDYSDRHNMRTVRQYDPYSLVLKEGVWYLYGFCHLRADFRLLKLSRIKAINITTRQFVRRASDVYAKLHDEFGAHELVEIELEFYSTVYADIEEWLGADAITDKGSKYYARATLYGGQMLINKILSFGSSVMVVSPRVLKEEIAVECKRIVANYLDKW